MLCGGLDGACVFGLRTGACVLWEDLMELVCCGEDSMEHVLGLRELVCCGGRTHWSLCMLICASSCCTWQTHSRWQTPTHFAWSLDSHKLLTAHTD